MRKTTSPGFNDEAPDAGLAHPTKSSFIPSPIEVSMKLLTTIVQLALASVCALGILNLVVQHRAAFAHAPVQSPSAFVSPDSAAINVRDEFNVYNMNKGSLRWNTPWTEIDDGNPFKTTGGVRLIEASLCPTGLTGECLALRAKDTLPQVWRSVDLSGAANATLSFRCVNQLIAGDTIVAEASNDGGNGWSTLRSYGAASSCTGLQTFDLGNSVGAAPPFSSDFRLRFRVAASTDNGYLYIDDVDISFDGGNVRDEFSVYAINDGSQLWTSAWIEINDDGKHFSATSNVRIEDDAGCPPPTTGECLAMKAKVTRPAIMRTVDLSYANDAELSFVCSNGLGLNDVFVVEASNDDGGDWDVLETLTKATNCSNPHQLDLSSVTGAPPFGEEFTIRMRNINSGDSGWFYWDDLEIRTLSAQTNIGGIVWADTDADGQRDLSEQGIANAKIDLFEGACDSAQTTARDSRTTIADGSYLFTGLPLGEYCLAVDASTTPPDQISTTGGDRVNVTLAGATSVDFGYASIYAADRLTVGTYAPCEDVGWLDSLAASFGATPLEQGRNACFFTYAVSPANLAALEAAALADSRVRAAEPDAYVHGVYTPNDPSYNNPSFVYGPQQINAETAWNEGTGAADLIVAVLDTGLDMAHPEFVGRVLPGYDFANDDADPADDQGHGTHVTGIVAAGINNGIGMAGMAGSVKILPVKVLNQNNTGWWSDVAAGITWAVDQGADVLNLSLSGSVDSTSLQSAVAYAVSKGVVVVVAAGNSGTETLYYPASYANVISFGATTLTGTRWSLSNYGPNVDVMAPGASIYSTRPGNTYAFMSGTSMASPHGAGVAALLLSKNPNLTPAAVKDTLQSTAVDMGIAGPDNLHGYGRIDAGAALASILSGTAEPPVTSLTAILANDLNENGLLDPGDTLRYSIEAANDNGAPLANVVVGGMVPAYTSYVPGSTKLNGIPVQDNTAPATPFPLDEAGLNIGSVPAFNSSIVTFDVVMNTPSRGVYSIVAEAAVTSGLGTDNLVAETEVAGTLLQASVDKASAQPGEVLTYSLTSDYLDAELLQNVVITAPVPAGTSYVGGSATAGGVENGGVVSWELGSAVTGQGGFAAGSGSSAITYNSGSSAATAGAASSLTWAHTIASGNNRILTVGMSLIGGQSTSVTYGGAPLTLAGRYTGVNSHTVEIWRLLAPPVGAANIVATFDAARQATGGGQAFNGVHQTTPTGTMTGASLESSPTAAVTISSAPGELVIDTLFVDLVTTATAGGGQTKRWERTNGRTGAGSTKPGASSVTMSWTLGTPDEWNIGALALKPAAGPALGNVMTTGPTLVTSGNQITITQVLTASEAAMTPVTIQIAAGGADAEEGATGGELGEVYLDSSDIEIVYDYNGGVVRGNQIVGLRFNNIPVPQGATITSAHLEFTAESADSGNSNSSAATLTIQGNAADTASPFIGGVTYDISTRARTAASVDWAPGSWTAGTKYNSPGISAIVQEIVARPGWVNGNSMAFIITGSGSRTAASFDGDAPNAAILHIEYVYADSIANVTPSLIFTGTNGVSANLISGPTPASATVGAAGTTFTWVYQATGSGSIGQLTFGGDAVGDGGGVGNAVAVFSSQNVTNPNNALGASDTNVAMISATTPNSLVLDLGSTMHQNTILTLRLREFHSGGSSAPVADIDSGMDGVNFASMSTLSPPGGGGLADYTYTITQAGGARYLRVRTRAVSGNSVDQFIYLDAVSFETSNVWPWAESNSVLVHPPLTFQVTVNDPPGVGSVQTTAFIADSTDFLPSHASNTPTTSLLASIGDRVWNDQDGDTIQDAAEQGIENVTVVLTDSDGGANMVVTGVDGAYNFIGLAAGTYTLTVDAATVPPEYEFITTPLTLIISLNHGEEYTAADFGFKARSISIGDAIWYDADADGVQDPGERGIGNVTLDLWLDNGDNIFDPTPGLGQDFYVESTVSNAAGGYRLDAPVAGTYFVDVTDDYGILSELAHTLGVHSISDPSPAITLAVGQVYQHADFGYVKVPANGNGIVGDLVWADENGDAMRQLSEPAAIGIQICATPGGACATTDLNGRYLLELAAGQYTVAPTNPPLGLAPTTAVPHPVSLASGQQYLAADFGYTTSTTPFGVIGGTIWQDMPVDDVVDGIYTPATEPGIPNVSADLILDLSADGIWDEGEPYIATNTDLAGEYAFKGLLAGNYLVRVSDTLQVLRNFALTAPPIGASAPVDGTSKPQPYAVALAAGETNTLADFGYREFETFGVADPPNPGMIGNLVWFDNNGNGMCEPANGDLPLAGVTVELSSGGITLANATTNIDGNYLFSDLPLGETYNVRVTDQFGVLAGFSPTALNTDNKAQPYETTLGLEASDLNGDFGYTIPGALSGVAYIDLNGDGNRQPDETTGIGDLLITVTNLGTNQVIQTLTGVGGVYSFDNLLPGTYRISAPTVGVGIVLTSAQDLQSTVVAGESQSGFDFGYIAPTAVDIFNFTAITEAAGVRLRWQTSLERDLEGFVVLRSTAMDGAYKAVSGLIPAMNNPSGSSYEWLDTSGDSESLFWYKIQAQPDGEIFGPIPSREDPGNGGSNRLFVPLVMR
ncbi:MAG: S8 family serine peptidase [Caldilineales bacterium]|nr:S8 family serine peptidase [Caldilineales bacterium]